MTGHVTPEHFRITVRRQPAPATTGDRTYSRTPGPSGDERDEAHALERRAREVVAGAAHHEQPLVAVLHRRDQAPAGRELILQRVRDGAERRRGDVDGLERRLARQPAGAVAHDER